MMKGTMEIERGIAHVATILALTILIVTPASAHPGAQKTAPNPAKTAPYVLMAT